MQTFTLHRPASRDTCWCRESQDLIGRSVAVASLPGYGGPGPVVRVTDIRHQPGEGDSPACQLVLDGMFSWVIRPELAADAVTVEITDEPPSLAARLREPIRHDGPMTLWQALELVNEVTAAYVAAGDLIPNLPGRAATPGHAKIRRAFAPHPPKPPAAMSSAYTRGRVRRLAVREEGLDVWAADLGMGGSSRQVGVYGDETQARGAVGDAVAAQWDQLEAFLAEFVHGQWTLVREPLEVVEEIRLNAREAATRAGVGDSTWRAYVARDHAPPPDGHTNGGRPWWHARTVDEWISRRPGRGSRTDLRGRD